MLPLFKKIFLVGHLRDSALLIVQRFPRRYFLNNSWYHTLCPTIRKSMSKSPSRFGYEVDCDPNERWQTVLREIVVWIGEDGSHLRTSWRFPSWKGNRYVLGRVTATTDCLATIRATNSRRYCGGHKIRPWWNFPSSGYAHSNWNNNR